jgi:hypothetical protein
MHFKNQMTKIANINMQWLKFKFDILHYSS